MKTLHFLAATLLVACGLLCGGAAAQSLWTPTNGASSFTVEFLRPSLPTGDYVRHSILTGAVFLSARTPVSGPISVVAEIPVTNQSMTISFPGERWSRDDTGVGNPYLGIEYSRTGSNFVGEAGIRLPLASTEDESLYVGMLGDFDRLEAFIPERLSVILAANYVRELDQGLFFRARGAPILWIHTGSRSEPWRPDAIELFLGYGLVGGYVASPVTMQAGLTGRMLVSESGYSLGDRTWHHLGASASVDLGRVRPGVQFRLPLDRYIREDSRFVLGLNAAVRLG